MQRSQRVTLADIAARSGVSTATASMILSERPDVSFSRETVLKVREAAEALGYRGIRRHRPSHLMAEKSCLLYTSPSPRDVEESRMPSSA